MAAAPLPQLTLVLGGARSGKSRHAEELVRPGPAPWVYVATAEALDDEMRERIAHHQSERGDKWQTLEAPLALPDTLAALTQGTVLVDCLTLWLSNVLLAERDVDAESDRLLAALGQATVPIVVVSNEVGLGIVPDTTLGRIFRDAQGRLNQRVAQRADRVVLLTAGIPLTLK